MKLNTPLLGIVDCYIDSRNQDRPIGHELSPATRTHYVECVNSFRRHLGREPIINDLRPEYVNQLLAKLLESGLSPYSVKSVRTGLRALMRFAKREGIIDVDPERLRRVHCPRLEVKGFGEASMLHLLAYVATLRGKVRNVGARKSVYYTAMLLTMWNIGCRVGDVPRIEVAKFDPNGRLWVFEVKTRKSRWHRLHDTTTQAIAACIAESPERELIWPGHRTGRALGFWFSETIKRAGLSGTSRFIRRGASSELDRAQPGMGWRFLNHSCPRVFEDHYRDTEICQDDALAPPELPVHEAVARICAPKRKPKRVAEAKPKPAKPVFTHATEVPLTDEVRTALLVHPLTDVELALLVGHLTAHGISQSKLAGWWGVAFKRYQDYRYGYREITLASADKLRRAFDLPLQSRPDDGVIPLGSLPATPEIAEALTAPSFGANELDCVVSYAKRQLGIRNWKLAHNIGFHANYVQRMRAGSLPVSSGMQERLRELFEV